jgi:hypothetical protein
MRHSVDAVRRLGWVYPCGARGSKKTLGSADRLRSIIVEAPLSESGWEADVGGGLFAGIAKSIYISKALGILRQRDPTALHTGGALTGLFPRVVNSHHQVCMWRALPHHVYRVRSVA